MSTGTRTTLGLASTVLIVAAFIAAFRLVHAAGGLTSGAQLAIGATTLAVLLKIFLGYFASKDFDFHNHGYDLCIMTLGTSLTAGTSLYAYDLNKVKGFILLIALAFIIAIVFTLTAAVNVAEIKKALASNPSQRPSALRTLANLLLGSVSMGFNLLIVISKADLTK
jgi:hypothetical protein